MDVDPLVRAKTYPYAIPDHSFVFSRGLGAPLRDGDPVPDLNGRTPVLAVGSNQSPEQLARKFPGDGWSPIPVIRVRLRGYDSVYSPHIASYGAIAATLQAASEVTVTLFVTWLDDRQLIRMHETEVSSANYGFGLLGDIELEPEIGPPLEAVHIYNSTRGTLCDSDGPIPVAEIPALGRSRPALSQADVQGYVRDLIAPEADLDHFIRASIDDPAARRQRADRLTANARPFVPAKFTAVPI